ncbi:MAG TPA: flagellar biosynthesis protein FlhF [Steroidobacteraceae bacterium]|jgi:flagellar biosynthesis protein FlhF|nr:flagellar biosynthesis protein FlhF [Steroidobacteraceae bacterium]
MKISKHTACDMRAALRMVREQLGPDAVIMSSRRVKGGVEVTAAIDFEVEREEQTRAPAPPAEVQEFEPEEFAPAPMERPVPDLDPYTIADQLGEDSFARAQAAVQAATSGAAPRDPASAALAAANEEMSAELRNLRRILETQLASLAWNDLSRRAPIHTQVLRELTEVGLSQEFASQIVAQLPAGSDMIRARRLAISLVAERLPVTGDRWLDKGGRVALVGPTGVGKTTALAKLAVRWVLRHGTRGLALISADSVRIGAHDQIQALGQMLDVPVYTADNFAEIPKMLESLGQKRFVLLDTPGFSQRDAQLSARLAQLASAGSDIETALVLSACTQAGAIAETVTRYAEARPVSCLLTKVDEAASLGGVLSVLTRAELPISYVSEGQRVPEDLRPARALELVSTAVQLAKASGAAADEDLLRRRYGEVAHALA